MNESHQPIIDFLNQTRSVDSGNNESLIEMGNQLVENPANFPLLCEIAANHPENVLKQAAVIQINKMIKKASDNWDTIDPEGKNVLYTSILSLFRANLPDSSFHTLFASVINIFSKEEAPWPEISQVAQELIASNQEMYGVWMFHVLIPLMPLAIYQQYDAYLIEISLGALSSENMELKIHAAMLAFEIMQKHQDTDQLILQDHVNLIAQIATAPAEITATTFSLFWDCIITPLSAKHAFSEEQIQQIAIGAFAHAQNQKLAMTFRTPALASLIPSLLMLGDEASTLFSLEISVCADEIQETDSIPKDILKPFEDAFMMYTHQEIYPLIQAVINEKISSENKFEQIAALLVFRIVLDYAPDSAQSNIEPIIEFLLQAIQDTECELMVEAALLILDSFDNEKISIQSYSTQFLPHIFQYCTNENEHIRFLAYSTCQSLLELIDSPMPELFQTVMALAESVTDSDSDWVGFLQLLSYSITLSEEIDDEQIDEILTLMDKILTEQSENTSRLLPLLNIGVSIMKRDDTQTQTILDMLGDLIQHTFNSTIPQEIFETYSFIGTIAKFLGESVLPQIEEFIQPMIENVSSTEYIDIVHVGALEALTRICKKIPSVREQILPVIVDAIMRSFANDTGIVLETSLVSVSKLHNFFDAEVQASIFTNLIQIILSQTIDDSSTLGDCFRTLTKLISNTCEQNIEEFLSQCISLAQNIIENTIPFLNGTPLQKSPNAGFLTGPVLQFLAELLTHPVNIVNEVTQYVLSWLSEPNLEYGADEISGVFTESVKSPNLTPENFAAISEAIPLLMKDAADPVTQQNLVFFLTTIIRQNPEMCNDLISFLPKIDEWYNSGKEIRYGYAETLANIGSLYLEIAVIYPDFPEEMIIKAIEEFPPADENECVPMANHMIQLSNKHPSDGVIIALALAIARLVVTDEQTMEAFKLPESTKNSLISILKMFATPGSEILAALSHEYSKQRAKFRKISEIL